MNEFVKLMGSLTKEETKKMVETYKEQERRRLEKQSFAFSYRPFMAALAGVKAAPKKQKASRIRVLA